MGVWHLFGFVLLLSWPCIVLSDSEQNDETGYAFSYNVFLPESGNYHGHRQKKDASGRTSGTYYLMGPDGVWHETTFLDSKSSSPEMAKYAENGLAVFFRMGKKSRETEKSKRIPTSPNTIPSGSGTDDFSRIEISPDESSSTIPASSSFGYKLNKSVKEPTSHISIESITTVKPMVAKTATSPKPKHVRKESSHNTISSQSDISLKSSNTQIAGSLKPTKTHSASSPKPTETQSASSLKSTKTQSASSRKPTKTQSVSNRKPTKTQSASSLKSSNTQIPGSLKPNKTHSASRLKPTNTQSVSSRKPTNTQSASSRKPTKTQIASSLKPTNTQSASSLKPTNTQNASSLKPTESQSTSSLKPTKTQSDSNLKPTKTQSASNLKPSKTQSARSLKPTENQSISALKPTISQSTISLKPTDSQIANSVKSSQSKSAIFHVPTSLTRVTDSQSEETEDSHWFRLTTPGSKQNYDFEDLQSFESPSSPESSGSFENSESHETTTSTFSRFNHFKNLVTPFLKPTLVPPTPTPLDEVFKKNPFVVDFGPFSGKFGNKAVGEVVSHFRTQKIGKTRVFEEALSDEEEEDEDDDNDEEGGSKETSLKKQISKVSVKDEIGLGTRFTELSSTTEKQEATTILFINKDSNNKDKKNEKRKEKEKKEEEEGEEEVDEDDETPDVLIPKPQKGRSLYSNPRLASRRRNHLNTKGDDKVATTAVTPKSTSYAVTRFTHIPISTTPETPHSTEDSSSEINLNGSAKTVASIPVVQIPTFKQSSKLKGILQRLQSTTSESPLPREDDLKKPEEVINKISFIDLAGPLSSQLSPVAGRLNQFFKSPNFRPRRVVLPRNHKLVDVLRKMAKEKPNFVSTKPFFLPLPPFNRALTSNLPNQVHLSGKSVDLLTIASNSGASYSIAPSLNDLPHLNHSGSKIIDPSNSLKKTSLLSLGQSRTFNPENVNKFIDKLRKDKADKPPRSFPPKEITLTATPRQEKSVSVTTETPKSGLRIVKAQLNAVRLLEPMPLSQYINLIKRPTTPKATFVIDGFPLNQDRDNNFSETSIRPSKGVRDKVLRAMTPRIRKSVPFRLLRYAPKSQNQDADTQTSKETKILMIKRGTKNSKVYKNKDDEQTESEDLSEKSLDKERSASSSQEKTADEASKQLDTAPGVAQGEAKLFLAIPPS